jgi:hypothetical protein
MKKIRRDKSSGVIIYIYMEISQGNQLCNYPNLKVKCCFFHFLFSLFSSTKSQNRRAEQILSRGKGWHLFEVEVLGKGDRE